MQKKCFKCGEDKDLSEFYKEKKMKDGYFNKCKECYKHDVRENRKKNVEYYREYDRKRGNRQPCDYQAEYRKRFPKKYKAQTMIGNAIRDKKLFKEPCEVCGCEKVHAHHDDYDKPLNVRWLCPAHHSQWHAKHGEALNPF